MSLLLAWSLVSQVKPTLATVVELCPVPPFVEDRGNRRSCSHHDGRTCNTRDKCVPLAGCRWPPEGGNSRRRLHLFHRAKRGYPIRHARPPNESRSSCGRRARGRKAAAPAASERRRGNGRFL